jgi:hypothetical protein
LRRGARQAANPGHSRESRPMESLVAIECEADIDPSLDRVRDVLVQMD